LQPAQVRALHQAAHAFNIPIICFGLRSDFQGKPFPGAAYLLTLADDIEEIKTICACGRKATMNVRFDSQGQRVHEGEQVDIGGNGKYVQVCARCFYQEPDSPKLG
jgi:thymidine kinase